MPRYRVNYGNSFEFDAQGPEEVVPVMQLRHRVSGTDDERAFMRRSAIEMCEWNGKNYYYCTRKTYANSMMKNGLLECVD